MAIIRKLEPIDLELYCCDFNDVCENDVTHQISEDDGTDKKYYCLEHTDEVRDKLLAK
jgi:hypothetical protein